MVQRYSYVLWRKPCLHISRVAESSRAHGHGTDGCSLQLECQYRAPLSPLDEHSRADQSWTEQGPLATLQNTLQTPRPHSRCCSSAMTLLPPQYRARSVSSSIQAQVGTMKRAMNTGQSRTWTRQQNGRVMFERKLYKNFRFKSISSILSNSKCM